VYVNQPELSGRQEQNLPLQGANVTYHPDFFSCEEADSYFEAIQRQASWRQLPIVLFGKRVLQPRLIAWYGERGIGYSYSGIHFEASGWLSALDMIRHVLREKLGHDFNAVLCNRYRDGGDSMGWHSDDELVLGAQPLIASVSLGETRQFRLRKKSDTSRSYKLDLAHGSVLIMEGDTQKNWQHSLPKVSGDCGERINLTFRLLPDPGC
jgi:alkylated DNA repair dioxygenase AlkB